MIYKWQQNSSSDPLRNTVLFFSQRWWSLDDWKACLVKCGSRYWNHLINRSIYFLLAKIVHFIPYTTRHFLKWSTTYLRIYNIHLLNAWGEIICNISIHFVFTLHAKLGKTKNYNIILTWLLIEYLCYEIDKKI